MKLTSTRFSNLIMFALVLFTGAASVAAQKPKPKPTTPSCPDIYLSSPDSAKSPQPLNFSVNVSGGDANITPTYNWTVSAGSIESGQGTPTITVGSAGIEGQSVTATVDVGGFPRECLTSKSGTTQVEMAVEARKIDEYGKTNLEDQMARLDNFAVQLQNEPNATAYIVSYGGRRSQPDEAQKTLDTTKNYLTKTRRMSPDRFTFINGGYREEPTTELWIVPAGATPPMASPTVDPSEVTPAKTPAKPDKAKPKTSKKS